MNKVLALLIATLAFFCGPVNALNLEEIVDICPGNFITQDFNSSWEHHFHDGTNKVYIPLTDKYNVYVLTQYLYQSRDFKLLTEAQLEHSCIGGAFKLGWQLMNLTGYDKSISIGMQYTNIPKVFRFNLPLAGGVAGHISGYSSIALTDNEKYVVFDFCYDNGLRSFAVATLTPYLDDMSLAVITAHLKSIGFKEKNFVRLNYQDCFDFNGDVLPYSGEVPVPAPLTVFQSPSLGFVGNNFLYPSFFFKKK